MKIGYPCINNTLPCTAASTFRLANYSEERLIATVEENLKCLGEILKFNVANQFLFFRLPSGIVPFGSHAVCTYNWQEHFKAKFVELGEYIRANDLRISLHPDQFVVINTTTPKILASSIAELAYQTSLLDLMELDTTAKVQIHVGGVYGDKQAALERFVAVYHTLPENIRARLCIENDDRLFSLQDCLFVHDNTGIPIIFDNLHHECLNNGEPMREAVEMAIATWTAKDGILMMDYSQQAIGERIGKHVQHITASSFADFLELTSGLDFDVMLEIKDKEASAAEAVKVMQELQSK